jgi:hypothetical protein
LPLGLVRLIIAPGRSVCYWRRRKECFFECGAFTLEGGLRDIGGVLDVWDALDSAVLRVLRCSEYGLRVLFLEESVLMVPLGGFNCLEVFVFYGEVCSLCF